jgi:hypothetical protein
VSGVTEISPVARAFETNVDAPVFRSVVSREASNSAFSPVCSPVTSSWSDSSSSGRGATSDPLAAIRSGSRIPVAVPVTFVSPASSVTTSAWNTLRLTESPKSARVSPAVSFRYTSVTSPFSWTYASSAVSSPNVVSSSPSWAATVPTLPTSALATTRTANSTTRHCRLFIDPTPGGLSAAVPPARGGAHSPS